MLSFDFSNLVSDIECVICDLLRPTESIPRRLCGDCNGPRGGVGQLLRRNSLGVVPV